MTSQETIQLDDLTLKDKIYELLKDSVIRHRFKPGERLLDQEIADKLGVSRTPVREALNRLGAEGLVSIIPRRGVFVTDLSPEDIRDLYQVREVLEVLAVRLAVPLLTDKDFAQLRQISDAFKAALDRDDHMTCFKLDREFHDKLAELSGNAKLREINEHLGSSIQISRWRHCQDGSRHQLSFEEHEEIMDALAQRDADLASHLIRNHIRGVKTDLLTDE
jgi:DNA-binding GntR family transcriptional regulator